LDAKDLATLLVSGAAFLLSVVATWFTWRNQGEERARNLRQELTVVMNKLVDADVKSLEANLPSKTPAERVISITELNQLRFLLAGQASFLMESMGLEKVTAAECNQLAQSFAQVSNAPKADRYFKLSIEKSDDDQFTHAVANRAYASFLFFQNDVDGGRDHFQTALNLLTTDEDYELETRAETLRNWAICEFQIGNVTRAQELREKAVRAGQAIKNQLRKSGVLKMVTTPIPPQSPGPLPLGTTPPPAVPLESTVPNSG
jgi:tetratricopeptide (TPR) repeat protein